LRDSEHPDNFLQKEFAEGVKQHGTLSTQKSGGVFIAAFHGLAQTAHCAAIPAADSFDFHIAFFQIGHPVVVSDADTDP
jgi:hypothetical protein